MSEVITTLNKKGDRSVEVYPNIKEANIPTGAVSTGKLADSSVTTAKIQDAAVTTDKINDGAVTEAKIGAGAVRGTRIGSQGVYKSHLSETPSLSHGVRKYLQYNELNLGDLTSYGITEFKLCYLVKRYDDDDTFTLIDDLKSDIKPYILIKYGYINKKRIIDMELSGDYVFIIFTLFDETNGVTTQQIQVNDFIYGGVTPHIEALSINI